MTKEDEILLHMLGYVDEKLQTGDDMHDLGYLDSPQWVDAVFIYTDEPSRDEIKKLAQRVDRHYSTSFYQDIVEALAN